MSTDRKYAIEVGLQVTSTHWHLYQTTDGGEGAAAHEAASGASFNVYLVLERPKMIIDPDSLEVGEREVVGAFEVPGPSPERHEFRLPMSFPTVNMAATSPYPHTELSLEVNGASVAGGKLPLLHPWLITDYEEKDCFKVSYVGQAQGRKKERGALERLKKHETLQKIQADIIDKRPENEVWIAVFDFEASFMWEMNSSSPNAEIGAEDSFEHLLAAEAALQNDRELHINLAEAALIRYFQPEYNDKFKKVFPSNQHTSYTAVYEHDVNALFVVLGTTSPPIRLHSDKVEPSGVHPAFSSLLGTSLRQSMLNLLGAPIQK